MNTHSWVIWLVSTGFPFDVTFPRWPPCSPEEVAERLAQLDPLDDWQTAKDQWLGAIITHLGFDAMQEWRRSLQDEGSIL
jgi:hypothetical protein